jgi:hypothetical protein
MTAKIPAPKLPKVKDPDAPEAPPPPPKSQWEKVLTYTPVVMTVVATLLAGLSNSELNAAQYERAWAAQLQSKIADQWNFFQVKRIRGSALDNTLELHQGLSDAAPIEPGAFGSALAGLPAQAEGLGDAGSALKAACERLAAVGAQPDFERVLKTLASGTGPVFSPRPIEDGAIRTAIGRIEGRAPLPEVSEAVLAVSPSALDQALRTAEENVAGFDAAIAPTNRAVEALRAALSQATAAANAAVRAAPQGTLGGLPQRIDELAADFTAGRLRYAARRYDQEALLNKDIAQLTEIHVRRSNLIADRHKARSQLFFFGMIIAQAAVIASTLALALKQRSLLWGLATAAGLVAVSFGVYVRFYV